MAAQVDMQQRAVRTETRTWPFAVDCRDGSVSVTLDSGSYALSPLAWRQKRHLARFVHLGEAFIADQFLSTSLPAGTVLPSAPDERAALSALALWVNAPDGKPGLPLDEAVLANVTLEVCRKLQLAPGAFDGVHAGDVELLWQATRRESPDRNQTIAAETAAGGATTRIVVIPDQQPTESPREGWKEQEQESTGPQSSPPHSSTLSRDERAAPESGAARFITSPATAPRSNTAQQRARGNSPSFRVHVGSVPNGASRPVSTQIRAQSADTRPALPSATTPATEQPSNATATVATNRISPFAHEGRERGAPSVAPAASAARAPQRLSPQLPVSATRSLVAIPSKPEPDPAFAHPAAHPREALQTQDTPHAWLVMLADELDAAARAAGIDVEG
ncbi:MAG TPA: hypothetical protein VER11_28940 [Polyangiaceae bacterium]|nr:hypothetical protein [Polyangiaceae bacterium]